MSVKRKRGKRKEEINKEKIEQGLREGAITLSAKNHTFGIDLKFRIILDR